MHFDFEGRNFDTPTVESAVSWREQVLVSIVGHVVVLLLVLYVPRLQFLEDMAERRAERIAEIAAVREAAQLAMAEPRPEGTFVFVAPRLELESDETPRPDAVLSDRDRVAESPLRTLDPESRLPVAEGNSAELVVTDDPGDGLDTLADPELEEASVEVVEEEPLPDPADERIADATVGQAELDEFRESLSDTPGTRPDDPPSPADVAESSLTMPGTGPADPDDPNQPTQLRADGLLGRAMRDLEQSLRQRTFGNVSGDTGRFGPEIQFDTKGVEFGPWIRRFVAQVRRNWTIPQLGFYNHGHVVLTFNIHRNGRMTDLVVVQPSVLDPFNYSAENALRMSNPTWRLPPEYPDDLVFFTVTFFFNERPPGR
jgi:outer membrane biosynthesis protein TonB